MKRIALIVVGIGIVYVSFRVGGWVEKVHSSQKLMAEEALRMAQSVTLDESALPAIAVTKSNALTSGTYFMESWIAQVPRGTQEVVIQRDGDRISFPAPNMFDRGKNSRTVLITNNVVSWTGEGALYEFDTRYVGIVDGNTMWGRVYGWGPGNQSIGIWRMYPKASPASAGER